MALPAIPLLLGAGTVGAILGGGTVLALNNTARTIVAAGALAVVLYYIHKGE